MKQDLIEKTEQWKMLERKTLEQRKIAEKFYDENLMTLISEDFIERNEGKIFEEVKYFVVSVGTSYEPIVLNLQLFHPRKVLFLCTEKSEKILTKIVNYLELNPADYEKSLVSETNPVDIYHSN